MSSVRMWTPRDLFQVTRTMDRLFDEYLGNGAAAGPTGVDQAGLPTYTLPVDIRETAEAYMLSAPVPGFAPEQVEVTYEDGMLTIFAQAEPLEAQGTWIRQERPFGSWFRRLQLPQQVQADKIAAAFNNGLLTVTVPKQARPEPGKISIGNGKPRKALSRGEG